VDKIIEKLKTELSSEDARYAYADSVTNAFLTSQINELREARDLTQEQLAELVGTKQPGISRWQSSGYSSCKVESLRKFAKAFGVRLRISFEEFGTLPSDVRGFTKERMAPRRFEDDPAFKDQIENPESAAVATTQFTPEQAAVLESYYMYTGPRMGLYNPYAVSDLLSYPPAYPNTYSLDMGEGGFLGPWFEGPPITPSEVVSPKRAEIVDMGLYKKGPASAVVDASEGDFYGNRRKQV